MLWSLLVHRSCSSSERANLLTRSSRRETRSCSASSSNSRSHCGRDAMGCTFLANVLKQQMCCVARHLLAFQQLAEWSKVIKKLCMSAKFGQMGWSTIWAKQLFIFLACCRHTNSAKASSSSLGLLYKGHLACIRNAQDESCDFCWAAFCGNSTDHWGVDVARPADRSFSLRPVLAKNKCVCSWCQNLSSTFVVHFVKHLDICWHFLQFFMCAKVSTWRSRAATFARSLWVLLSVLPAQVCEC